MVKKLKKQTKSLIHTSLFASAGSVALGAIGGNVATSGQTAINRTLSFAPAIGTIAGASALARTAKGIVPKKKKGKKVKSNGIF